MKRNCITLLAVAILSGCASTSIMPDENYRGFGTMMGAMERCFDEGKMDTQLFAQGQVAFSYILKTWEYDGKRLAGEAEAAYKRTTPNDQNCRRAESYAYQAINRIDNHQAQSQARSRANTNAWNEVLKQSTLNRPVFCNTIGTTTMCN